MALRTTEQNGVMPLPQEKKKPEITRRQFLKYTAAGTAVVLGGAAAAKGVEVLAQVLGGPTAKEAETTREILGRIQEKYGVEIPAQPQTQYAAGEPYVTIEEQQGFRMTENGQTAILTSEEAKIVEEALSKIPSPGSLAQLILPFRFQPSKEYKPNIPHAFYLGRVWQQWLKEGPSACIANPNRPVDDRAAVLLFLPEKFSLTEPLPQPFTFYPLTFPGQEPIDQPDEISRTTQGEYLKQVIIHENGHAFADQISWEAFPTPAEHCRNTGIFSICGLVSLEDNHPLYRTFSKVNGWRLADRSEVLRSCGIEPIGNDRRKGWLRDSKVWGEPTNLRISHLASESNIDEAFAEFFMASILFPKFLTEEERRYFENIHTGLRSNPRGFIQETARDPHILLRGIE